MPLYALSMPYRNAYMQEKYKMEPEGKDGIIYGTITKARPISLPDYKPGNGYDFFVIKCPT